MIALTGIILFLGLQVGWAQTTKPPNQLQPDKTSSAAVSEATVPSPATKTNEVAAPAALPELPPVTETLSEVPVDVGSDYIPAEVESLKPTNRDPFAKPKSLIDAEVEKDKPIIDPSVYIDMRIEAIRRYPLREYVLVGIIFDVDSPKAMVKDRENNMHLLTTNQRIGNQEGLIVKIERGELVVEEKGKLVTLKLRK